MKHKVVRSLLGAIMLGATMLTTSVRGAEAVAINTPDTEQEAKAIFRAVADKLAEMKSLRVDLERRPKLGKNTSSLSPFERDSEITLMRDGYIRIDRLNGILTDSRVTDFVCDGKFVWEAERRDYIMEKRPMRPTTFNYGNGPLVQYFFKPQIEFDPFDRTWKLPISAFDDGRESYSRLVTTRYLGAKTHLGERVRLVEIQYSMPQKEYRQLYYINDKDLISQVDMSAPSGAIMSELYRNYRIDEPIDVEFFAYREKTKMPVREVDPVRIGEIAPDFELPLNTGGTIKLSELLKGKKGVLVSALDGALGNSCLGPDEYLAQMRIMQQIRDKFGKQGLEVVAVVGGDTIIPEVKEHMLRAWMPDQTRFSYPIAIDLDLERGIQGSAYHNFQLNGRNNILLDKDGRVVFAGGDFAGRITPDRSQERALYQALSQIGFVVTPADMEPTDFDDRKYIRAGR